MARQQLGRLLLQCVESTAITSRKQTLSIAPYALGGPGVSWQTGWQTRSCSSKGKNHPTYPHIQTPLLLPHVLKSLSCSSAGSSGSIGSDSIQSSTSSPTAADPLDDQFSRMMEVMMENPTVMQMMTARMPPHMRNPEVLKALMSNPDVRSRMTALAQEKVGGTVSRQLGHIVGTGPGQGWHGCLTSHNAHSSWQQLQPCCICRTCVVYCKLSAPGSTHSLRLLVAAPDYLWLFVLLLPFLLWLGACLCVFRACHQSSRTLT